MWILNGPAEAGPSQRHLFGGIVFCWHSAGFRCEVICFLESVARIAFGDVGCEIEIGEFCGR
jgi:hypothetical protein